MADSGQRSAVNRTRLGWWLFVLVLALAAAFIAYSFVGLIVLGVFGYYATRPVEHRIESVVDSDGISALSTVLLVLVPLVALVAYVGLRAFSQARQLLGSSLGSLPFQGLIGMLTEAQRETLTSVLQNPRQFLTDPTAAIQTALQIGLGATAAVFGAMLLLALSVTLAYFLLEHDDQVADGLRELFGGRDTTAYAYAAAVDEDLESVFFGNFLFVLLMAVVAAVAYGTTNALAPQSLHVPMVFVLAFLTGVASLIPIVVGKVVYLPVVAFLAFQAVRSDGSQLFFVGGVLVAYFLVLDILPQTFLQPYITGRQLDTVLLMFGYLLGPVLFGWYGFFLLPIVFVLMLEAIRIVLPELVHGEPMTPDVRMGDSVGTTPRSERDGVPDADEGVSDGDAASDDE